METNGIHNQTWQRSVLRFFCIGNRELMAPTHRIIKSSVCFSNKWSV